MKSDEFCSISEKNDGGIITTQALKILLNANIPLILLDARDPQWDDGQRITRAISLTSKAPLSDISRVLPNKQALIVVYCSNQQCGASSRLEKVLVELGYLHILKYAEGIEEWISQKNRVQNAT